jgi:hypothetical protein
LPTIFIAQVCSVFYQFLPTKITYDAAFKRKVILCAEKVSNHAADRKYTVSAACVHNSQSINTKLFSCLINRKSFPGPKKGRNPENDASALRLLPVTREALMPKAKECARNSNIPFKASRGWCAKFMKRESLSLQRKTKISQKLLLEF